MHVEALGEQIKAADAAQLDEIERDLMRKLRALRRAEDLVRLLDEVAERRRELNVRQPGRLGVVE